MDREEFAKLIATACAAYSAELAPETVEIYWRSLASTPFIVASHRLKKHIENQPRFPRVSELRKPEPEGVRFYGPPIDLSKRLPAPEPDPDVVDRALENMREAVRRAPGPTRLPRPEHKPRVEGACSCRSDSAELCDYCRSWASAYG